MTYLEKLYHHLFPRY